ncbi:hypothetical protein RRG08_040776 [Elysia crispata]|uniref:Uncharacterized protein n=1 Tax=Elysia crispata TaxID=231223 RepID=A0AAE1EE50_9GAST|nr:hypothetical protein RRG08_040776 [Elysia crispata]
MGQTKLHNPISQPSSLSSFVLAAGNSSRIPSTYLAARGEAHIMIIHTLRPCLLARRSYKGGEHHRRVALQVDSAKHSNEKPQVQFLLHHDLDLHLALQRWPSGLFAKEPNGRLAGSHLEAEIVPKMARNVSCQTSVKLNREDGSLNMESKTELREASIGEVSARTEVALMRKGKGDKRRTSQ